MCVKRFKECMDNGDVLGATLTIAQEEIDVLHPSLDDSTFLKYSIQQNNPHVAMILLEKGASVDMTDIDGCTSLHCAVRLQKKELVEMLIEYGAYTQARDKTGWTPLHYAAWWNLVDIAKILVSAGASPYEKNSDRETPRQIAIEDGNRQMIELFDTCCRRA